MDFSQIDVNAVSLMVAFLNAASGEVGKKLVNASIDRLRAVYDAVSNRIRSEGDPTAQSALARFERQPMDAKNQDALIEVVRAHVSDSKEFSENLAKLVLTASRDESISSIVTNVSAQAQVGKIVNVHNARDIHIG